MTEWRFGGFDFIANGLVPSSVDIAVAGRLAPEIIPWRDGAILSSAPNLDPVSISIRGDFKKPTAAEMRTVRDALSQELQSGEGELYLNFDDRYILAFRQSFTWIQGTQIGNVSAAGFSIDFFCAVPFWISTTLNTSSYTTNVSGQSLSGGGNAPSPAIINVTAPAGGLTAFAAENATTGETIIWAGALTIGQILSIDTDLMIITEGGVERIAGFSGEFWSLEPGTNNLSFTSTPTGAAVEVKKRARWYP